MFYSNPREINLPITMSGLNGIVPPGVVTGDNLLKLMTYCRENSIALPAFNCTSSSTINAILEAAKVLKSPVIIQVNFKLTKFGLEVQ